MAPRSPRSRTKTATATDADAATKRSRIASHDEDDDADGGEATTPTLMRSTARVLTSRNLIREMIAELLAETGKQKAEIDLTLGDPTKFGAPFLAPRAFEDAVVDAVRARAFNGYAPSMGYDTAREAVASTRRDAGATAADVVITSGCSAALEMAFRALAGPGDVIVVPVPAFPLYETITHSHGISVARYRLDPAHSFEADLDDLKAIAAQHGGGGDADTVKAVLVNNPSNPVGVVYSRDHLRALVAAIKANFPRAVIITDEIYDHVVFAPGSAFHAVAPLALELGVPCVTVGGISKNWMVPGWRLGWLIAHDAGLAGNPLHDFRRATRAMSMVTMGACTLLQAALPAVLTPATPAVAAELADFRAVTNAALLDSATAMFDALRAIPGVRPHTPTGAMYLFAEIDLDAFGASSTRGLCRDFLVDEGVLLLPGDACFRAPFPCVRISIAVPRAVLLQAAVKLAAFQRRRSFSPARSESGSAT